VPVFGDIKELEGDMVEAVDVVHGGWPCQPYSGAGKRRAFEDDRDLWPQFMRLVRELRPAWVVGENVDGFIRLGLDRTLHDLERGGYAARAFSVPAGAVGAPHRRFRTFVVAHADRDGRERGEHAGGDGQFRLPRVQTEHIAQFPAPAGGFPRRDDLPSPRICRAGDGIPDRVHRIKALGNSVCEFQAYPVFRAVMEAEEGARQE
jgi:DNA (cytosine-5)-methyltransferase 1